MTEVAKGEEPRLLDTGKDRSGNAVTARRGEREELANRLARLAEQGLAHQGAGAVQLYLNQILGDFQRAGNLGRGHFLHITQDHDGTVSLRK